MESLPEKELEQLYKFGQLLFQDPTYTYVALSGPVADEAERIRRVQNHRQSYQAGGRQRPHRWDIPALTRHYIACCWYFNDWTKAREAQHPLTSQDFLRCYCAYLFGKTIYSGSAHVAIALGCHYWRYRPRQIEALAPDLINDPTSDYNCWAQQLKARFPSVAHNSLRVVTEAERDWVATFLDSIAPASQDHCSSENALETLFSGMEPSQEGPRIHTLLARCCGLARLLQAYNDALNATWQALRQACEPNMAAVRELLFGLMGVFRPGNLLPDPADPAVQPRIPVMPGEGDRDVDSHNSSGPEYLPTPASPTDLGRLQKQFAEAQQQRQQRRQQYRPGVLEIRVDGELIDKFDVQAARPFRFEVPCEACRVQIYGQDAVGPLLLAVFPLAEVAPAARDNKVSLQLTAARQADGTLTDELVELTYLPSQRVAAFAWAARGFPQVHRVCSGLARHGTASGQAVGSASRRWVRQVRHGLPGWWEKGLAGWTQAWPRRWVYAATGCGLLSVALNLGFGYVLWHQQQELTAAQAQVQAARAHLPVRAKVGIQLLDRGETALAQPTDTVAPGQRFRVYVVPEVEAYVYVVQTDGTTVRLLNAQDARTKVRQGVPRVFPAPEGEYQINGRSAQEAITVICSPTELPGVVGLPRASAAAEPRALFAWRAIEQALLDTSTTQRTPPDDKPFHIASTRSRQPDALLQTLPVVAGQSVVVQKYAWHVRPQRGAD
jgi:Domain of unknown function (DUF4384)